MKSQKIEIPACADCELCDLTVLKSLSTQDLEFVSKEKIHLHVKKGQRIFSEGNPSNGLYALYTGKVKIHKEFAHGQEAILQLLKPGDVFGYKAILCEEKYTFSATALEDSLVCLIPNDVFSLLIEKSHSLKKDIIFQLTDQLDGMQKRLSLNAKTAREKVFDALLSLVFVYGLDNKLNTINVNLSRTDLANLASLTLETTVRTMTALRKEGIIEVDKKAIKIIDKTKFIKEAQAY